LERRSEKQKQGKGTYALGSSHKKKEEGLGLVNVRLSTPQIENVLAFAKPITGKRGGRKKSGKNWNAATGLEGPQYNSMGLVKKM